MPCPGFSRRPSRCSCLRAPTPTRDSDQRIPGGGGEADPGSVDRPPVWPSRIQAALKRCFQTRDGEMALDRMLGDSADH